MNPEAKDYLTTAHSTIRLLAEASWQSQKDTIRKQVQSALSNIHISLDIWTSPNRILLLGICAHFFDRNSEQLCKSLLALRPVIDHSGEAQFETLLDVLQDYGIVRKVGAIVCDNAPSNDVLCRTLSTHLEEEEDIQWNPVFHRVRCMGHVLNLAVSAFLFPKTERLESIPEHNIEEEALSAAAPSHTTFRDMGPLRKLHNIAVYIRNSPGRTKEFKELARRIIPLDNRTRWNSWFQMIEAATECHSAIDLFVKNHPDLDDEYLERNDWKQLEKTREFLKPFYQATMYTQGSSATIDRVLFAMDILIQHLNRSLVSLFLYFIYGSRIKNCFHRANSPIIQNGSFEFRNAGKFWTSIIARQTTHLSMRPPLSFTHIAERNTSEPHGPKSGKNQLFGKLESFGWHIEKSVLCCVQMAWDRRIRVGNP